MAKKSKWSAKLQMYYPEITETALSPDGSKIVYAIKEPLMTKDKSAFITHLYFVNCQGGNPIQLTDGKHTNHTIKWSPDNSHIAFISNRAGKNNIFIMRIDGGEAWPLTEYSRTDVVYHTWAPDGKSLAFLMPKPPGRKKKRAIRRKNDVTLYDKDYSFNHVYWVPFTHQPQKLPKTKRLTSGRFHVFGLAWMPDGASLAVNIQPTPLAEDWCKSELAILPLTQEKRDKPLKVSKLRKIANIALWGGHPFPSPDGNWIACTTSDKPVVWAGVNHVVLYSPDGGQKKDLAHTPDGQSWIIGWSRDNGTVIVGETWGVDTHIYGLPISGHDAMPISITKTFKSAIHTNDKNKLVYAEESYHLHNRLRLLNIEEASNRIIVTPQLPVKWPSAPLPSVDMIRWSSDDGMEIEGSVVYPTDYTLDKQYPLIVEVHGGPMGVFNRRYLGWPGRYCDVLSAAENGFIVLRPNPRGSSGYGKEFRLANYNDWGFGDFRDIMAGVDDLIERGIVDANRIGIMGWSYGGFMTSWAITRTNRFKAACVGAGVTNLMSFNGTTDIPGFIPDYFTGEFWDVIGPYQKHSPMFNIHGVKTPTLIQHGCIDERVPLEQGLQLYNALKRQQVTVDMVIYPRQHHSITEPRLRMDMRRRPIKWFKKWLLTKE